ncbi:MAG: hypothetical protein EBW42_15800, partial [Rhodobacterales bacterium]|nr:hypothetical protein [Rhodobacterales bacterium]
NAPYDVGWLRAHGIRIKNGRIIDTMIAAAHGAFAEKVKDPTHLRSSVQRVLKAVRVDRRQALLEICIS